MDFINGSKNRLGVVPYSRYDNACFLHLAATKGATSGIGQPWPGTT